MSVIFLHFRCYKPSTNIPGGKTIHLEAVLGAPLSNAHPFSSITDALSSKLALLNFTNVKIDMLLVYELANTLLVACTLTYHTGEKGL